MSDIRESDSSQTAFAPPVGWTKQTFTGRERSMGLTKVLELLFAARQYVAEGETRVIRQRKVVDRLNQGGRDPLEAILFLEHLEEMQEKFLAHQDHLEKLVVRIVRPD